MNSCPPFSTDYEEFFSQPVLLGKSMYGIDVTHKVLTDDLHEWLETNNEVRFWNSEVDPSLCIYRNEEKNEYLLFLICYVDDCLYFCAIDDVEANLGIVLKKCFHL